MKNLHWMAFFLFICVLTCYCRVSAFQCSIQFSYVGCTERVEKEQLLEEWQFGVTEELLSAELYYDEHRCKCVMKAEELRYKHIALFQTPWNTIACYGVRFGGSLTLMAHTVIDNQLQTNDVCYNAYLPSYEGDVLIGNGQYSAVYSVTSSIVTLPRQTTTTVKTMLLTSTTRKAIYKPKWYMR